MAVQRLGGRTAGTAAATVADATIRFARLLVAMVITEVTLGKLERSSGGGVDAVVDLGGACWMTEDPCCWLGSWVCREWKCGGGSEGGSRGRRV